MDYFNEENFEERFHNERVREQIEAEKDRIYLKRQLVDSSKSLPQLFVVQWFPSGTYGDSMTAPIKSFVVGNKYCDVATATRIFQDKVRHLGIKVSQIMSVSASGPCVVDIDRMSANSISELNTVWGHGWEEDSPNGK